jgi:hypothetical protein
MGGKRLDWATEETIRAMAIKYHNKVSLQAILDIHGLLDVTPQCLYQVLLRRRLIRVNDGHREAAARRPGIDRRSKLTPEQVLEAFNRNEAGEKLYRLALEYGTGQETLSRHFARIRDERKKAEQSTRPLSSHYSVYEPSSFIRPLTAYEKMTGRRERRPDHQTGD